MVCAGECGIWGKLYVGHSESNYFIFGEGCYVSAQKRCSGTYSVCCGESVCDYAALAPLRLLTSMPASSPGDAWQACVVPLNHAGGGNDSPAWIDKQISSSLD